MTKINTQIAGLKDEPICSDCFKSETKSIFRALNFDKKDFLRDVKGLRQQIINLEKFKYPADTCAPLLAQQRHRFQQLMEYKRRYTKSSVDEYSHKFYSQYNDKLRSSVDVLDKKLAVFNSMPDEEKRNLMGCDIDL